MCTLFTMARANKILNEKRVPLKEQSWAASKLNKRPTTCLHVPNSFSMHTTPVPTISKEMTKFQTRRCPNHVIQIQMDSKQEIWNGCSIRGMYWKQFFLSSWTWIWDLLFNSLLLPELDRFLPSKVPHILFMIIETHLVAEFLCYSLCFAMFTTSCCWVDFSSISWGLTTEMICGYSIQQPTWRPPDKYLNCQVYCRSVHDVDSSTQQV